MRWSKQFQQETCFLNRVCECVKREREHSFFSICAWDCARRVVKIFITVSHLDPQSYPMNSVSSNEEAQEDEYLALRNETAKLEMFLDPSIQEMMLKDITETTLRQVSNFRSTCLVFNPFRWAVTCSRENSQFHHFQSKVRSLVRPITWWFVWTVDATRDRLIQLSRISVLTHQL